MDRRQPYIDGIYNYCDRWCERCAFTQRCRAFAMEREIKALAEHQDRQNAEFWKAMERTLGDAIDEIGKQAERLEPPPDPRRNEEMRRLLRGSEKERALRRHPLAIESLRYLKHVQSWLRKHHPADAPEHTPLGDALAVIRWYQHFIHVKFCRALSWFPEFDEDAEEDENWLDQSAEIPSDSDGSAKIAIIGIERSISAWSALREQFPNQRDEIVQRMVQLVRLRALADRTFPKARGFHRPGFDDEPSQAGRV